MAGSLRLPYDGWGQFVSTSCASGSFISLKVGTIVKVDGLTLVVRNEGRSVSLTGIINYGPFCLSLGFHGG